MSRRSTFPIPITPRGRAGAAAALAGCALAWACAAGDAAPDAGALARLPGAGPGCTAAARGSRWAHDGYRARAAYGHDPNGWLSGPSGVAATPDGRVAVLDGASSRVVVLDSLLHPVREFGRRGDGPGELQPAPLMRLQRTHRNFNFLAATDTALYAYDFEGVEVFGWDGHVRRHLGGLRGHVLLPHTLRVLTAEPGELVYGFDSLDADHGRHRMQTWAVVGERHRLLGELLMPRPRARGFVGPREARALWAARGRCVVMADGGSEWVLRLDLASGRVDTVPLPAHEVPAWRASDDEKGRSMLGLLRGRVRGYDGSAPPPAAPSLLMRWTEMAVDPDGWLWVRPWQRDEDEGPVQVVRVSLQTGRAEKATVPAFPHAFGPPGVFYSLQKDPDTDEVILVRYDAGAGR
ncbi:MAG TPA: hypothetical protein VFJ82_00250 [Longimicrobium sp.]|nr:hypothetical protein [Longimicrobium sp.]